MNLCVPRPTGRCRRPRCRPRRARRPASARGPAGHAAYRPSMAASTVSASASSSAALAVAASTAADRPTCEGQRHIGLLSAAVTRTANQLGWFGAQAPQVCSAGLAMPPTASTSGLNWRTCYVSTSPARPLRRRRPPLAMNARTVRPVSWPPDVHPAGDDRAPVERGHEHRGVQRLYSNARQAGSLGACGALLTTSISAELRILPAGCFSAKRSASQPHHGASSRADGICFGSNRCSRAPWKAFSRPPSAAARNSPAGTRGRAAEHHCALLMRHALVRHLIHGPDPHPEHVRRSAHASRLDDQVRPLASVKRSTPPAPLPATSSSKAGHKQSFHKILRDPRDRVRYFSFFRKTRAGAVDPGPDAGLNATTLAPETLPPASYATAP